MDETLTFVRIEMNPNEHDKIFRLSQVPQQLETSRHNSQLLHELKAHQQDLENQNDDLRQIITSLRELTKRYSDHYELAPNGFFTITSRGLIKEANQRACSYLKISRSEILGSAFTDYLSEEDFPLFIQHLHSALLGTEPVICELRLRTASGEIFEGELVSAGWRNDKDGSLFIRSSLQNISRRKKIEADLMEARDNAETMNSVKSKFLANMSHEMRTPLGVVIGYTDLLLDAPSQSADMKEGLKTIQRNSLHLLNLIDDLLDLAKIEAGKMTMEILPFSLEQEMQTIVGQFAQKAECKGLKLQLIMKTKLPAQIHTDPIRFRQIILNVLSNALKFTEAGSINVIVSYEREKERGSDPFQVSKPLIYIDVIDTGCGIRPEQKSFLFEPFSQAEVSTTRRFGGSGLGLCLSRRFAEALGGNVILLKSEENKGSIFRITIDPQFGAQPLDEGDAEPKSEDSRHQIRELPSLAGIKILVVEDGLDNQILIKKLLENVGAEVECAEDGEQAIDGVLKENYDVVLMDIQLPIMDGYEATLHLRQQGCLTPIIALTAHALEEDRQKAEAIGFNDFISKPIDWPKLAEAIVRCRNAHYH